MAAPYQQVMDRVSSITIKEKVSAVEAITAALGQEVEMANKYKIYDQNENEIFFAVEQTDFCTRQLKQCLGECAAWDVDILYTEGGKSEQAFKLKRDFTMTCCCFNRPVVDVETASGYKIGSLTNPFTCCNLNFDINDAAGEPVMSVNGGCCQLGLICPCPFGPCAEVTFEVLDAGGNELGEITKRVPGCCKWMIADDVDNYNVDFEQIGDSKNKILLMAAAIFMDFRFFNNNSADGQSGLGDGTDGLLSGQ